MASEVSGVMGSLTGGAGALMQGQAQANALDRAASIERNNAALDIQTGQTNAAISSMRSNKAIGGIAASYGANGIAGDSGSVLNELAASTSNAELDRQNIMHGAQVRAVNYQNQATMDDIGAQSALKGSYFNAISSVMMGGSKAWGQSAGVSPGDYQATTGGAEGEAGASEGEAAAGDTAMAGGDEAMLALA